MNDPGQTHYVGDDCPGGHQPPPTHMSMRCPQWVKGHHLAAFRSEVTCDRCKHDFSIKRQPGETQ